MNGNEIEINAEGHLVLPANVVSVLGWQPGTRITFEISGAGIRLERARARVLPQDQRADLHSTMEMSVDQIVALTAAKRREGGGVE